MLLIEKLPSIKFKNRSHLIVDNDTGKTYYINKLTKEKIGPKLLMKEYVREYLNYILVEDRVKVKLKIQLKLISNTTRITLVLPDGEVKEFKNKKELAEKIPYSDGKKYWVYKVSMYQDKYKEVSIAIFVRE